MKYVERVISIFAWILALLLALAMASGIADGKVGWAVAAVLGFAYALRQASSRAETLERRIIRLEGELGKHQRFHGHYTDY